MADPVIPNGIRAQVVLGGKSGLPEDSFVTTWAFLRNSGSTFELQAEQAALQLQEFWTLQATTNAMVDFLSPAVVRSPSSLVVKLYDLEQTAPREPIEFAYEIPVPGGSSVGLPAEVAVCLSFYSERNLPRSRGRVYIGPLSQQSAEVGTNGRVHPSDTLVETLATAANRMRNSAMGPDQPQWAILSQRDAALKLVTNGWVDDAFDTQRRRGEIATERTIWGDGVP